MFSVKKINSQTVIIMVLALIVVGFAYNEWGKDMMASIKYKISNQGEKDQLQIGEKNATFRIIEYYSYNCEYCKIFEDEIKPKIVKNYVSTGRIKWIYRPVDPEMAIAVLCANDQGKFLEYHDSLFRNAVNISKEEDLKQIAKNVGINEETFWQCYSSDKYEILVAGWYNDLIADIRRHKIPQEKQGTPAFLIGDEMVTGMQSYSAFTAILEEKLRK